MALKSVGQRVPVTAAAVYTVPSGKTARVVFCQAANIAAQVVDLTVSWTDASASNAELELIHDVPVPTRAALSPIAGELVLNAGDSLRASASAANGLHLTVSVDEV